MYNWRLLCSARESHPLCSLKNPPVVYTITCRLSGWVGTSILLIMHDVTVKAISK